MFFFVPPDGCGWHLIVPHIPETSGQPCMITPDSKEKSRKAVQIAGMRVQDGAANTLMMNQNVFLYASRWLLMASIVPHVPETRGQPCLITPDSKDKSRKAVQIAGMRVQAEAADTVMMIQECSLPS